MLKNIISRAKESFAKTRTSIVHSCNKWLNMLVSVELWILVFFVAGTAATVIGVRILAGDGWAIISAGIFFFLIGVILMKGAQRG